MVEDDSLIADDTGAFTKVTTGEPEIGTTHLSLLSSQPREEPKTFNNSDAPTIPQPRVESLDRPTSPDVALIQHPHRGSVRKDSYGAAAVASTPTAISPPLPQQPQGQDDSASDGGGRRMGNCEDCREEAHEKWHRVRIGMAENMESGERVGKRKAPDTGL